MLKASLPEEPKNVLHSYHDQPFVLSEFEKPGEVALYYGFVPINSPTLTTKDRKAGQVVSPNPPTPPRGKVTNAVRKEQELNLRPEERCALFRAYKQDKLDRLPQPTGLYYTLPLRGDTRTKLRGQQHVLEILGSKMPIADATVIRTALAILKEEGHDNVAITINSVGDEESQSRFRRALMEYFRLHRDKLSTKALELVDTNVFALMHHDDPVVHELKENAPNPMDFLDEVSRQRFMAVLEFLETLDIAYEVNPLLVGDVYTTHSVFEIRSTTDDGTPGELLGRGGCYTNISAHCGLKSNISGVGITLCYTRGTGASRAKFKLTRMDTPQSYFMQLGPIAKLKSLKVIEDLRQLNIPMRHALCKEKCFGQMAYAKQVKLPYLIIMGQKEALEDTVVIRDMETYAQEIVRTADLPQRMKKLMKK